MSDSPRGTESEGFGEVETKPGGLVPPEIAAAVAAVWQRLGSERDVLVLGSTGSGRSTVLGAAVTEARSQRAPVVRVGARGIDAQEEFAALLAHPLFSAAARSASARDAAELARLLEDEVRGGLLVVDDIDLMDEGSLAVVDRVVRRPGTGLLASAHNDLLIEAESPARRIVGAAALSEVRLQPLGFEGMAVLLDAHLGGPTDPSLTSAVVAYAAGNPAAAVALVDAARWSGGIRRHHGRWAESRPLATAPHDAVVHALSGRLTPALLRSLELLACAGPVPLPLALRLVGDATLSRLGEHERVCLVRTGADEVVEVSPPALAEALHDRVGPLRRRLLSHLASAELGAPVEDDRQAGRRFLDRLISGTGAMADEHCRPVAERAALARAHAVAQDTARRGAWALDPTVANAVRYLDGLVAAPAPEQLAEVFDRTLIAPTDPAPQVVLYRSRQAEWMLWQDDDLDHVTSMLSAWADGLGPEGDVLRAQARLFGLARSRPCTAQDLGAELDRVAAHDDSAWVRHLLGGLLVERGCPEQAVALMGAPPGADETAHGRDLTEAVADARLLRERPEGLEPDTRAALEEAFAACDPLAIREHALRLAEILHLTGDRAAAWRVLAASLRLGPPSPFRETSYVRALSLGAVLRADAGDLRRARALRSEAERHARAYRPVLDSRRHCATAAILHAEGRTAEADDLLWEQGCADADAGFLASALLCWTSRRSPCSRDQVARVGAVLAQADLPVFEPLVRLHEAITDGRADAINQALRIVGRRADGALVGAALDRVDADRAGRGLPPLSVAQAREITPTRVTERELWSGPPQESDLLSHREREIALLARGGLANREIAHRLHLSIRTVENHMYRITRKLKLTKRVDLQTDWDPSGWRPSGYEH